MLFEKDVFLLESVCVCVCEREREREREREGERERGGGIKQKTSEYKPAFVVSPTPFQYLNFNKSNETKNLKNNASTSESRNLDLKRAGCMQLYIKKLTVIV